MESNPSFPQTVEAYKSYLKEDVRHSSFQTFCRSRQVSYAGITQWMRRHSLSVSVLHTQALLEQYSTGEIDLRLLGEKISNPVAPRPVERLSAGKEMSGVSIVFPDGVSINVRQSSPQALAEFIGLYNQLPQ